VIFVCFVVKSFTGVSRPGCFGPDPGRFFRDGLEASRSFLQATCPSPDLYKHFYSVGKSKSGKLERKSEESARNSGLVSINSLCLRLGSFFIGKQGKPILAPGFWQSRNKSESES